MLLEYWQYSYAGILTNESDRKVTKRQILGKIIPAGQ
jgi:hypothetical protein